MATKTQIEEDKITLQVLVNSVYLSPRYYHSQESSEIEAEIRQKAEAFKTWANNLINEKLK